MAEDKKGGILNSIKSMFTQKVTMGAKESARPEEASAAEPEQKGGVEQVDFDVIKASFTNIESSLEKMNTVFTDIHETLQQLFTKSSEDEYKKEEQASEAGVKKPISEKKDAVKEEGPGFFDSLKSLFMNPAVIAALAGIVYTVLPKETQEKIKAVLGGFASGLEKTTGGISGLSTGVKAVGIALATFFTAKFIKSIGDALTTVVNMVKSVGRMGKFGKMALVGTALVVGGKMLADKFGEDDEKDDDEDEKTVAKAEKEDKGEKKQEKPAVEEKKADVAATAAKEPEKEAATGGGKSTEGGAAGSMAPGAAPTTSEPQAAQAEQKPSPADSTPKGFMEQVQEKQVPKKAEAPATLPSTPAQAPAPAPETKAAPEAKPAPAPSVTPTPAPAGAAAGVKKEEPAKIQSGGKFASKDDFVKGLMPYAEKVSNMIGGKVPPIAILGQWAGESGMGKSLPASFNYAGIKAGTQFKKGDFVLTEERYTDKQIEQAQKSGESLHRVLGPDDKMDKKGRKVTVDEWFGKGAYQKALDEGKKWVQVKSYFAEFSGPEDFATSFAKFISSPRYSKARQQTTARGFGYEIAKAGYATASAEKYAEKVGSFADGNSSLASSGAGSSAPPAATGGSSSAAPPASAPSATPAPSPKAQTGTQIAEMSTKNEAMASQRPTAPIVNTSSQTNNMSGGGAPKPDSQNVQTPIPIANRGSLKTATKHSTQYA